MEDRKSLLARWPDDSRSTAGEQVKRDRRVAVRAVQRGVVARSWQGASAGIPDRGARRWRPRPPGPARVRTRMPPEHDQRAPDAASRERPRSSRGRAIPRAPCGARGPCRARPASSGARGRRPPPSARTSRAADRYHAPGPGPGAGQAVSSDALSHWPCRGRARGLLHSRRGRPRHRGRRGDRCRVSGAPRPREHSTHARRAQGRTGAGRAGASARSRRSSRATRASRRLSAPATSSGDAAARAGAR